MAISQTFQDTLDCLNSIIKNYMIESNINILVTIRKKVGFLRILSITILQAQTESTCGKDHLLYWSYFEEECNTSACTMGNTSCLTSRLQHADRYLANKLQKLKSFRTSYSDYTDFLTHVQEIEMFFEPELVESFAYVVPILLQSKTLEIACTGLRLFGSLIQSLWNIMNCKSNLFVPEVNEEKLRFMSLLKCFCFEDVCSHVGSVDNSLAYFSYLYVAVSMDHDIRSYVNDRLTGLLRNISLEQKRNLLDIYDDVFQNMVKLPDLKDQISRLNKNLKVLQHFTPYLLTEDTRYKEVYDLLMNIKDATFKQVSDLLAEEADIDLIPFIQEVNALKVQLEQIYPTRSSQLVSKVGSLISIDVFLRNLEEILQTNDQLVSFLKFELEAIYMGTKSIISFLEANENIKTEERYHKYEAQKDLISRCINVVYEAEYMTENLLGSNEPSRTNMLWLCHVLEDIEQVKSEFECMNINCLETNENRSINVANKPSQVLVQTSAALVNDVPIDGNAPGLSLKYEIAVGFKEEEKLILELLKRDLQELDVISIVGMPGLGKTTLAKKIFNHEIITKRFDVRLWSCVSQIYKRRELLLDMLSQLIDLPNTTEKTSDDDLADTLRKNLLGKRFLIVADDVWDKEAWDNLIKPFPKQQNGSRILLTSRYEAIALHAKKHSDPFPLRFFTREESWELLRTRIFGQSGCPFELMEVGKKIAGNSRGLPLITVILAGLLANIRMDIYCWNQVADSIDSDTSHSELHQWTSTIELSYHHLPEHLKPCFLHLAAFPEDNEISVSMLLRLWIAERFIPIIEHKTLENTAEDYLMDLISRSLVIVAKRRSRGGVKTIIIHDLVHDFCLTKAKEENFLDWVYRGHLSYDDTFQSDYWRLCAYPTKSIFKEKEGSSYLHSLHIYNDRHQNNYCDQTYFMLAVLKHFKFLRVLDIKMCLLEDSVLIKLYSLIHLRYLAVNGNVNSIHASVANLQSLQTFIVKGFRGEIKVTDRIWELTKLRHLHVDSRASFQTDNSLARLSSKLVNLCSFSTPTLSGSLDIAKWMPNLNKLKCIFQEGSWIRSSKSRKFCTRFPDLISLNKLECLKIMYLGEKVKLPFEFGFPLNLKKLTLSKFRLPWSEISQIAALPNLVALNLLYNAFEGDQWDMKDEKFLQLKLLKLEKVNLRQWSACAEAFPSLDQLVLNCWGLEEIPSSFNDVYSLQMIQVKGRPSLVKSALDIQEYFKEDLGIDAFKVVVFK